MYLTIDEAKRQYAAEQRHKEEVARAYLKGTEDVFKKVCEWLKKKEEESGMTDSFIPDLSKSIWGKEIEL